MHLAAALVELTIVMPCLDEVETIGACIAKAQRWLRETGTEGEVVVADNGSTDGSPDLAKEMKARVVHVTERGYGNAVMGGILAARGKYVVVGDADDTYDFGNLTPFLEKLRDGHDVVIGNRFKGGIEPGAMPFLHRYVGNPVLTWIGRLLFRRPCGDFHCGLRAFSTAAAKKLDLRTTGMEFASELVVKAALHRMRVAEVPTTLSRSVRSHPPHLRTWRDGWRHLRFLLLYSPRWLFLYPGLLLMLVGAGISFWLIPGPRVVRGVTFDVHTLLYAALAILMGFQAVTFAVFTKIFAITEGLLPEDPRLTALFKYVRLETGLLVGFALIGGGIAGTIYAVSSWQSVFFGPLAPSETLRTVIPAVLSLTIGSQVVLASLFLSILGLARR
jgi:glycosyltransferase involved in cell wall biosynthesis